MRKDYLVHEPGDYVFISGKIHSVTINENNDITYNVYIGDNILSVKACDIYLPHLDAATKTVLMGKDYDYGLGRYE